VHDDAEAEHAAIADEIENHLAKIIPVRGTEVHVMNPAPVALHGVVDVDAQPMWVHAEAFGSAAPTSELPGGHAPVTVSATDGIITLSNGLVSVSINTDGAITSIRNSERDLFASGDFAHFTLRQDTPAEYDAWDVDMTDANAPAVSLVADSVPVVVESSPLRATVECLFATESSRLVVRYSTRCVT
jgi:hypothetical protein